MNSSSLPRIDQSSKHQLVNKKTSYHSPLYYIYRHKSIHILRKKQKNTKKAKIGGHFSCQNSFSAFFTSSAHSSKLMKYPGVAMLHSLICNSYFSISLIWFPFVLLFVMRVFYHIYRPLQHISFSFSLRFRKESKKRPAFFVPKNLVAAPLWSSP